MGPEFVHRPPFQGVESHVAVKPQRQSRISNRVQILTDRLQDHALTGVRVLGSLRRNQSEKRTGDINARHRLSRQSAPDRCEIGVRQQSRVPIQPVQYARHQRLGIGPDKHLTRQDRVGFVGLRSLREPPEGVRLGALLAGLQAHQCAGLPLSVVEGGDQLLHGRFVLKLQEQQAPGIIGRAAGLDSQDQHDRVAQQVVGRRPQVGPQRLLDLLPGLQEPGKTRRSSPALIGGQSLEGLAQRRAQKRLPALLEVLHRDGQRRILRSDPQERVRRSVGRQNRRPARAREQPEQDQKNPRVSSSHDRNHPPERIRSDSGPITNRGFRLRSVRCRTEQEPERPLRLLRERRNPRG